MEGHEVGAGKPRSAGGLKPSRAQHCGRVFECVGRGAEVQERGEGFMRTLPTSRTNESRSHMWGAILCRRVNCSHLLSQRPAL